MGCIRLGQKYKFSQANTYLYVQFCAVKREGVFSWGMNCEDRDGFFVYEVVVKLFHFHTTCEVLRIKSGTEIARRWEGDPCIWIGKEVPISIQRICEQTVSHVYPTSLPHPSCFSTEESTLWHALFFVKLCSFIVKEHAIFLIRSLPASYLLSLPTSFLNPVPSSCLLPASCLYKLPAPCIPSSSVFFLLPWPCACSQFLPPSMPCSLCMFHVFSCSLSLSASYYLSLPA